MPGKYYYTTRRRQGFTLIEMMAVLVVVGIIASVVTLSMGDAGRPQQMKSSARQLYSAMGLALENAVFLNQQMGLRFDFSGAKDDLAYSYEWLYFNLEKRQWQPLPLDDFETTDLPVYVHIELEVDGQDVAIGAANKDNPMLRVEEDEDGNKGKPEPDLYFLSSGEMQPFRIRLFDRDTPEREYVIVGDALGQLTFRRPDEDEE